MCGEYPCICDEEPDSGGWSWNIDDIINAVTGPFRSAIQLLVAPLNSLGTGIELVKDKVIRSLDFLNSIWGSLKDMPNNIKNMLTDIFIPKITLETRFSIIRSAIDLKFNMPSMDMFATSGGNIENINANVNVMGVSYTGTVVNLEGLNEVKSTVQNWARGVVYIMLIIYNINQVYKMIRGTYLIGGGK